MTKQSKEDSSEKIFGFKKPQPGKGVRINGQLDWIRYKAAADIPEAEDRKLWRVHDDLYDFSKFNHPGGWDWLDVTRGNDITELVESSHPNIEKIRKLMPKYRVRACSPTSEPRNSAAFTFEKDGFYSTFRERAWKILKEAGTGPTAGMLLIHDSLLLSFLGCLACAVMAQLDSLWMWAALAAGLLLQCLGTCSHNFYHQRPNWRGYTWDITPYSSYEWKISHAYSHHTFPNTVYDYEMTIFEPFLLYLPKPKGLLRKLLTPLVILLLSVFGMHIQSLQRYGRNLTGQQSLRWENTIPFCILLVLTIIRAFSMAAAHGGDPFDREIILQAFWVCAKRLNIMYCIASFFFHNISLSAGHHDPLIWCEGDKIVDTVDWGIFQIISVARFETVDNSLFLTSTTFGNHALHHLLPTVDHSKLPLVWPTYVETCKEFGIDFEDEWFKPRGTKIPMIMGWIAMVKQTFRTESSSKNYPFHLAKKKQQ